MSGELQTIPARHGVATFVPRGRTIKIINTYGKQVVSTWAFGLHAPPEEGEDEEEEEGEEEIEEKTKQLEEEVEAAENDNEEQQAKGSEKAEALNQEKADTSDPEKVEASKSDKKSDPNDDDDDPPEQAPDDNDDPPEQAPDTPENEKSTETIEKKKPEKRTWSSYLPSMPYRNKGASAPQQGSQAESAAEKAQNEATSKKWSSYLPTGKSFSSYVPNVQLPDSKGVVSAFQASHYRDPNKSYAEQLYDFSKTPVGAGSIAAATGSGTASSIYAAYSAYTKMSPSKADQPPMEYLSLPHTRASSHRLVPEVDDTLLTNLRNPIMTLVEDNTPGAHDTLTAACDASQYAHLGIDKPEEHGSCAVNLVLALKELNEKSGLKGTKAIGADITVNIAPTPLHLFMNAPIELDAEAQSEGAGAKGAKLKVEEPKGSKRSFVRFRAERDMVIVMSACPMDVGKQNGGRCMAANFMVEEASEEDASASTGSLKKGKPKKLGSKKEASKKEAPKKEVSKGETSKEESPKEEKPKEDVKEKSKSMPRPRGGPAKIEAVKKSAAEPAPKEDPAPEKKEEPQSEETPKAKKKPKKLERRGAGTATPT